jgi:hypothetical protein
MTGCEPGALGRMRNGESPFKGLYAAVRRSAIGGVKPTYEALGPPIETCRTTARTKLKQTFVQGSWLAALKLRSEVSPD